MSPTAANRKRRKPQRRAGSALTRVLVAAENAWLTAVQNKDARTFDRLMAPQIGFLDEGGLMSLTAFKKSFAGEHVEMLKTSRAKAVRIDRDTALLTYTLEQKGTFQGQPFPPKVYATTTWVKRRGTWRAVFHQESTPAKPSS